MPKLAMIGFIHSYWRETDTSRYDSFHAKCNVYHWSD